MKRFCFSSGILLLSGVFLLTGFVSLGWGQGALDMQRTFSAQWKAEDYATADKSPEWIEQTLESIQIMGNILDDLLSRELGEDYEAKSRLGLFSDGCHGYWIPQSGLLFTLSVDFPLKTVGEGEKAAEERTGEDLWEKYKDRPAVQVPATSIRGRARTGLRQEDAFFSEVGGRSPSTPEREYIVEPGDTLSKLAEQFDTTAQELTKTNDLSADELRAGMKLKIPAPTARESRQATRGRTLGTLEGREGRLGRSWYGTAGTGTVSISGARYDALKVRILSDTILEALAKYGHRFAGFEQNESITVVVNGAESPTRRFQPADEALFGETARRRSRTSGGRASLSLEGRVTTMVIQVPFGAVPSEGETEKDIRGDARITIY